MSLMKSSQRGHVMPGGDRPLLNVIDIMSPTKPSRRKAWPLANWCIFFTVFQPCRVLLQCSGVGQRQCILSAATHSCLLGTARYR